MGVRETESVRLLPVRVVWLALPLTAGSAAMDVLDGWREAPRTVAAALLWLAWGAGVVALLAPRPAGVTAIRVIAPTFAVLGIVVAVVVLLAGECVKDDMAIRMGATVAIGPVEIAAA